MPGKPAKVTDPVCEMSLEPSAAATSVDHEGQTYYFCSSHCAQIFMAHPAEYATAGMP
jgi:Cu+-exporting ATPase